MDRWEVQRRLLASEAFWFGGARDAPPVFASGDRFNAEPHPAIGTPTHRTPPIPDCKPEFYLELDLETGAIIEGVFEE